MMAYKILNRDPKDEILKAFHLFSQQPHAAMGRRLT